VQAIGVDTMMLGNILKPFGKTRLAWNMKATSSVKNARQPAKRNTKRGQGDKMPVKFENVRFPDVGFQCRKCGLCCRQQPADLTTEEQEQIRARGFRAFLGKPDGIKEMIRFIRRKKDGSCYFLTEDNRCAIYDIRPAVCKLQPFLITDWDYENNVIELDLPVDCDCKGISAKGELPIEEIARAAQTTIKDLQTLAAKFSGLPATDRRVLYKTRMTIISLGEG